ncbi:hypothetical protein B0H10DRAFT_1947687 [Mycena sp. CBHHK59/15]|nr:hypothetical protein B0H10DRAFT_1947687 [Mycena sp. CBHHK59/15]
MEVDSGPDTSNDNGDICRAKRCLPELNTAKVRLVNGPQRDDYDNVRDMEMYHKEQVILAKQKNHKLVLENQQLFAQLEAAEKLKADHIAFMNSMHEEINSKSKAIQEMQQHEGQLEAQFLGDQDKLQKLCNTMFPQLVEAQKLLLQRNDDVNGSTDFCSVVQLEKKDEAIQLRNYSNLQGKKKTAQNKPPPRRGTAPVWILRYSPSGTSNPKPNLKLAATPALANLLGTDVDTLSGLIGKLERLLSDDVTVTAEKTTPKKRIAKKFKKPDKDLLNHINQASDFVIYNPAEDAKVAACEDGLADPADDHFQWDFGPGYSQRRWNDLMISKVVDAALADDGEDGEIAEAGIERDYLESLMAEKLRRYQSAWKGFQPRYNQRLGCMETMREARARGTQASEQHQLSTRSTSSKNRKSYLKFEDRVKTITATIEIKKADGIAGDIATWEKLLDMTELLGPQGMSSEEEDEVEVDDAKVIVYMVKLCIWREPLVVEYLRFVDAQTAVFKQHQRGPTPGSRIKSGVAGSSKAPCGLPKSLYNREWPKTKSPAYLKQLKISKEAFGLLVAATGRMEL